MAPRRYGYDLPDPELWAWRLGRKIPRNIYCGDPDDPRDDDAYLGCMDTELLAARAVEDHNRALEGGDAT